MHKDVLGTLDSHQASELNKGGELILVKACQISIVHVIDGANYNLFVLRAQLFPEPDRQLDQIGQSSVH